MTLRRHHRRREVCRGGVSTGADGPGGFKVTRAGRRLGKSKEVLRLEDGDLLSMASPVPLVSCPIGSRAETLQCALTPTRTLYPRVYT